MTPPMTTRFAVAEAIDVHFHGGFQEFVDEDRPAGDASMACERSVPSAFVVDDFHRPSAQHEARPDQYGEPDVAR